MRIQDISYTCVRNLINHEATNSTCRFDLLPHSVTCCMKITCSINVLISCLILCLLYTRLSFKNMWSKYFMFCFHVTICALHTNFSQKTHAVANIYVQISHLPSCILTQSSHETACGMNNSCLLAWIPSSCTRSTQGCLAFHVSPARTQPPYRLFFPSATKQHFVFLKPTNFADVYRRMVNVWLVSLWWTLHISRFKLCLGVDDQKIRWLTYQIWN